MISCETKPGRQCFIMVNSTETHDRWWQKVQKNTELGNLGNKNFFVAGGFGQSIQLPPFSLKDLSYSLWW